MYWRLITFRTSLNLGPNVITSRTVITFRPSTRFSILLGAFQSQVTEETREKRIENEGIGERCLSNVTSPRVPSSVA